MIAAAAPVRACAPTLVVADDHPPFVDGLARVLPELCEVRVVARCADGRAALAAIERHDPELALLDLRMPQLSGRAVLGEVVRRRLRTRVLIHSAHCEPAIVRALIEDGARGYVSKSASWDDISTAIRAVAGGRVWLSPDLQDGLNDDLSSRPRAPSERELQVLALTAEGLTDAQIAARLYISRETVRTNLKRCSEKLGVSGRAALVATALRRGLLQ